MVLLIRFVLVSIIVYLIIRSFARFFEEQKRTSQHRQEDDNKGKAKNKGVSKEVGEFIDYEEVD
ncbi:MAG TPA: hypothetical protein VMW32_02525 [Bacteroidales bacterium]|nr:hypothetical protein [Bacteroidales bacterium]